MRFENESSILRISVSRSRTSANCWRMSRCNASRNSTSACPSACRTRSQLRANRTSANPEPAADGSNITTPKFTNSPPYHVRHVAQYEEFEFVSLCHLNLQAICAVLRVRQPIRKRISHRHAKRRNQLTHHFPALQQGPHQRFQRAPIAAVPLRRDLPSRRPNIIFIHLLDMRQPRLERIPSAHLAINFIPRINPAHRRVRKGPLSGIKTIPLIDERRGIFSLPQPPPKVACRPLALPVHLSIANIPAKVSMLRTRSSISIGR